MTQHTAQSESGRGNRVVARLNAALDKGLMSYAAVASAAGVGVLTTAQPAQAKIVYTPANVPISRNQRIPLDLNHDGIRDFFFFLSSSGTTHAYPRVATLSVDPVRPDNRIWGNNLYASALSPGVSVGPGGKFQREHDFMVGTAFLYPKGSTSRGPWKGTQVRYLGLKFLIAGTIHYGWARVQLTADVNHGVHLSATLTGYAYETIAGKSIITGKTMGPADDPGVSPDSAILDDSRSGASMARSIPDSPQPASLGMLALGAQGVPLWRRKESVLEGD